VPYIVMEIVEGRTIRDLLLNAEAPGPEQALIIVSGVLEALAYSHQHGIHPAAPAQEPDLPGRISGDAPRPHLLRP
jgi:hypothetical protein